MSLPDSAFSTLSSAALARLADLFESADGEGLLEAELSDGTLTLTLASGKQFVVNRHGPSRQIWLSSPISGGLHFDYDEKTQSWVLKDGRQLEVLLKAEVEKLLKMK